MATNDLIKGLILGALGGLLLGILYAPKSGRETREDIRKSTEDIYDKTKEQYRQAILGMEELVGEGRKAYTGKKEQLKKAVEAGVEAYKEEKTAAGQA
jgi:gas vesicle protein